MSRREKCIYETRVAVSRIAGVRMNFACGCRRCVAQLRAESDKVTRVAVVFDGDGPMTTRDWTKFFGGGGAS